MEFTLAIINIYHMGESGKHVINVENNDDILSSKRQVEIEELVNKLASYKPTKIFIEVLPEKEKEWNEKYNNYLNGKLELDRNEIEQVGFRLAKILGHKRLYGIDDFNEEFDWGESFENPFEKYKNDKELKNLLKKGERKSQKEIKILKEKGVIGFIRYLNSPKYMKEDNEFYIEIAKIRREFALWVKWWYGRNFNIFRNILNKAQNGDKILVIIGAGHGYFLREISKKYKGVRLIDIRKYLK
ncbi:MAG: DUF5694 domain-containing protein [Candidatus Hydrothermales bacterium]